MDQIIATIFLLDWGRAQSYKQIDVERRCCNPMCHVEMNVA